MGLNRNSRKSDQRAVLAQNRRMQALELRIKGKTTTEIARQLGIDASNVRRDIRRAYNDLAKEQQHLVERLRNLTQVRLEALLSAHWETAVAGNREATQTVLNIIDRELKLFGLDRTTTVNFNQVSQFNLGELQPDELLRRARMVGLDLTDLRPDLLGHDPNVIEVEVTERETVPILQEANRRDKRDSLPGLSLPVPDSESAPESGGTEGAWSSRPTGSATTGSGEGSSTG